MPGNPVVGTYRRYKAGTNKSVAWLVESAQRCASHSARDAKAGKSQPEQRISVATLITYANQIVKSKRPRIQIEPDIIDLIYDVIAGRRQCVELYGELHDKGDGVLNASKAGHIYFVKVLDEVLTILKTEYRARLPRARRVEVDATITSETSVPQLSNIFSILDIEETVDNEDDSQPTPSLPKAGRSRAKKTVKAAETTYELDDGGDEIFAIWCTLQDLFDIRMHVRQVWQDYVSGTLTYSIATRLTDAATMLSEVRIRELVTAFPHLIDFQQVQEALGSEQYLKHAALWIEGRERKEVEGLQAPEPLCQQKSDLLLVPAWEALTTLGKLATEHPDGDPTITDVTSINVFGWDMPMPPMFRRVDLLFQVLRDAEDKEMDEYSRMPRSTRKNLDNFTRQLLLFIQDRLLRISVLNLTQINLDIIEILNGDSARGLEESLGTLNVVQSSIKSFQKYCINAPDQISSRMPHYGASAAELLKQTLVRIDQNGATVAWRVSEREKNVVEYPVNVPLTLMSTLPLLPAHIVKNLADHKASLESIIGSWQSTILAIAYLYRAAQASGLLAIDWKDMDWVIDRQNTMGKPKFCRVTRPSVRSVQAAYYSGLGIKIENFARNRRGDNCGVLVIPEKGVKLSMCSPFNEAFAQAMEQITSVGPQRTYLIASTIYESVRIHATHGEGIRDPIIAQQYRETRSLTGPQLLTVLQETLLDDEMHWNFDHLAFYVRCVALLAEITEKCNRESAKLYPEVVANILDEAALVEIGGTIVGFKDTMLLTAAEILREEIEACGDERFRHAKEASSKARSAAYNE